MDYATIYNSIISSAASKNRNKQDSYYEKHHILPRSLGGTNKKSNLVLLTAKEHFICHLLLVKMYKDDKPKYKKMLHAFMLMRGQNKDQERYINSVIYETLKKEYSVIRSENRKGKTLSIEQKKKISESMKKHHIENEVSIETKKKISDKAKSRKRNPFSDEYKNKMSEIMKQRHRWK